MERSASYSGSRRMKFPWLIGEKIPHAPPKRKSKPPRLRRLGGRGSVRDSPCDEPARLRPPFFLQRGYPRERISSGSGALYLTLPRLLRRLRRTLLCCWLTF